MDSLRSLPIDEFKSKIKPVFDEIVKQLPADKQSSINFDEIIIESYNRLQKMEIDVEILDITLETHPDVQDTACVLAVINVMADVLFIVLGLTGLSSAERSSIIGKIIKEISPTEIKVIEGLIMAFNDAGSKLAKAKFVVQIFGEIFKAVGAKAFWKAMQESMSWVEWVTVGIAAIAQITLWVGTDGAALVAEVVLLVLLLVTFTKDILAAQTACASTQ